MLDTIAALGFATAMNVSGVNVVRIEQQRDFALANGAAPTAEIYPSVFAVVRLMTNSSLVDCMTGRSAGFFARKRCSNQLALSHQFVGNGPPRSASNS